jgi:hypothetical protein
MSPEVRVKRFKDCCISDQYDGKMGGKLGMLAMNRRV